MHLKLFRLIFNLFTQSAQIPLLVVLVYLSECSDKVKGRVAVLESNQGSFSGTSVMFYLLSLHGYYSEVIFL
jgi:predicted aconitase with swiveling domain